MIRTFSAEIEQTRVCSVTSCIIVCHATLFQLYIIQEHFASFFVNFHHFCEISWNMHNNIWYLYVFLHYFVSYIQKYHKIPYIVTRVSAYDIYNRRNSVPKWIFRGKNQYIVVLVFKWCFYLMTSKFDSSRCHSTELLSPFIIHSSLPAYFMLLLIIWFIMLQNQIRQY